MAAAAGSHGAHGGGGGGGGLRKSASMGSESGQPDKKKNRGSKVVNNLRAIEEGLREKDVIQLPWIKTAKADTMFGMVILMNAGFIGIDLEFAPDGFSFGFWAAEGVFLLIFLIELCMRIGAECPTPWRFFIVGFQPEWWGVFDFAVTIIGCVDCWVVTPILTMGSGDAESPMSSFTVLRVFRLIRLARLIRVLRMFNELVVLVQTLGNSIRAVGWMSLLLAMIIYTGSIICVIVLGEPNKDNPDISRYFGSLGDALFSHFCVVTLEAWPDIAQAAMQQTPFWAFYFVGMITLTNFALVNLMVGVIVERIIHFSLEQETELSAFVAESEQFRLTLKTLFSEADIDRNGEVTREEVRGLMEDKRTHEIMTAFGINLDIPPNTLFTIMDLNTDGETTFEEFFNACMRLCGSKQSIHSIFVQHDICEAHANLVKMLTDIENHVAMTGGRPRKSIANLNLTTPMMTGAAGENDTQASPEDCVSELLERMDRFGQVQLKICAEIEKLKVQAHEEENGPEGRVNSRGAPKVAPPTEAGFCGSPPIETGFCGVDALFCKRKESIVIAKPTAIGAKDAGKQTRKDLEAEFRKSKK